MTSSAALNSAVDPQGSTAPSMVVADDLTIGYDGRRAGDSAAAVSGVNLHIRSGEIFGLVGPTGSGKSTLAAAVAGRAGLRETGSPRITGGELTVDGIGLRRISKRRRDSLWFRVGYVPQDAGALLREHLTVSETIADPIFSRDRRFDQREVGLAVAALLDAVRLPLKIMDLYPHEISRGQRQRVAIARELILDPVLFIADDPTAGVDVLSRDPILDVLAGLRDKRGMATLITTHSPGHVARICDRMAVMEAGVIMAVGSPTEPDTALGRRLAEYRAV
jgi:peptide/nickel transport system ATP-binding protein